MAISAFNKFNDFTEQVMRGVHNFGQNTYKIALTNSAPNANQVSFDSAGAHLPPTSANGYPVGGAATTITVSETAGATAVQGTQVIITASGGNIGPFRYAILYNDSATSPTKALVGWFDYGSSITLSDTESITVQFNSQSPGTIFTLS